MIRLLQIAIVGFVVVSLGLLVHRAYELYCEPTVDSRIAFDVKLWRLDMEYRYAKVPLVRAFNSLERIEVAMLDSGVYSFVDFEQKTIVLSERLLEGGANEAGKASLRVFLYQAMSACCYGLDDQSCSLMNPRHGGEYYYTMERAAMFEEWSVVMRYTI